jgi:hypothetical protein
MSAHDEQSTSSSDDDQPASSSDGGKVDTSESPKPDEAAKEKAADMMTAYEDRPTLILPGTGGAVSGTAVGDWLDEDGNPKYGKDEDARAAKAKSSDSSDDEAADDETSFEEQIEIDKEFNKAVIEAAERDNGVSEEEQAKAERSEKSVTR